MIAKILKRKFAKFLSIKTVIVTINLIFVLGVMATLLFTDIDNVLKCLAFLVAFLIYKVVENFIDEIIKEKEKVIRPKKRFTYKNEDTGAIEIKNKDIPEAVLFLYEMENKIGI